MAPKNVVLLAAAMIVVAALAFALGRQTGRSASDLAQNAAVEAHGAAAHSAAAVQVHAEARDLSKVTIENLAHVEFEQAYELLRGAPRETIAGWAERLQALPTSPRKTAAIAAFYKCLAQVDTSAAVDLALLTRNREARATAVSAIEATAPAANMREVARMLLATDVTDSGLDYLMSSWSETDPVSASAFAESHPSKVREYGVGALLNNWAALDPVSARQWLERLEPSRRDASVYREFYSGWLERDRHAAVQHLIANGSDEQLREAAGEAAAALFSDSADAAHAFIMQVPSDVVKTAAVERIARSAGGPAEMGLPAVDRVARWLLTLPAEVAGPSVGSVVAAWNETDPAAVDDWLQHMPMQKRDWVAAKVCLSVQPHEPHRYFETALKISDPQLRAETLRTALQQIGSPARARKLLRKLNLPAASAAELEGIVAGL